MGWFDRWNADKCKATLKVAAGRTKLLRPKLETSAKKHKREIAQLLKDGKTPLAKIKAEQVLQDMQLEAALEILGIHCELLQTRMGYIDSEKECPRDLMTAVCTVLYAQPRVEVPELADVKRQFELKYGKEWVKVAAEDSMELAHPNLVGYLSVEPPAPKDVSGMLAQVALENGLDWKDPDPPADVEPARAAAPAAGEDLEARLAALRSDGVKPAVLAPAGKAADLAPSAPPASVAPAASSAPAGEDPEVAKMKAQLAALEAQLEKERQANQASQSEPAAPPPAAPSAPSADAGDLSLEARLAALTGAPPSNPPQSAGGGYAAPGASMPPAPDVSMPPAPGASMPPAPGASMAPPPPAPGASMAPPPGASMMAPPPATSATSSDNPPVDPLEARLAALRGDVPKESQPAPSGTIVMPPGGTIVQDSSPPPPPPGSDPEAEKMAARLAELEAELSRAKQASMPPPAPSNAADSEGNPFNSFIAPPSDSDSMPPPPPPEDSGATGGARSSDPEMQELWKRFECLKQ